MTQSSPTVSRGLVVTQGDPDGVGPELILHVAAQGAFRADDVVFADADRLERRSRILPRLAEGFRRVKPLLSPASGQVDALRRGVDAVLQREGAALVTAPIDKAVCKREEGFAYTGHTEYLAARAGGCDVAMVLVGPTLRVALATIHIPLREVPGALDVASVVRAGRLLAAGLQAHFGVARPRVAVLGLNPHAGERGVLGDEEERVITPAVRQLGELHDATFVGPLPADTAFFAHARGDYDGIVAMYHDQGLAPFKLVHFHDGVNLTLGLPFVRTSPDHGTAKDIAGTGTADPSSFAAAIALARGGP